MRARDLIAGLDIRVAAGDGVARLLDTRICDLTEDSRTVMPGSLFVARRGLKSDGRLFVPQALLAGAVAILTDDPQLSVPSPGPAPGSSQGQSTPASPTLVLFSPDLELATAQISERFYGDPSEKLTLIGVTGTNGKTTTTFLIHQILNAVGVRCGLIGTVCIDDGTEVADATLTTPPALEVSRTLSRMVEAGCKAAVMEVSSHALHQRRVGALRFRAGVFTNLTGDHLDYHHTMEAYADAKAMLFAALPGEAEGDGGVAVLNIQDPAHTRMKRECKARVYRTAIEHELSTHTGGGGTAPESVCRARVLQRSTGHTTLRLSGPWGGGVAGEGLDVRVPLVGSFNVMNALQAVTTVYALYGRPTLEPEAASAQSCVAGVRDRVSMDVICEALSHAAAPPGRLEPVTREGEGLSVFVDYAHTDDALRTVLSTLRESMGPKHVPGAVGGRQLVCVFGCGGDRDTTKRPRMGRVAAELADRVIITSDNPRSEDPRAVIAQIVEGVAGEPALLAKITIEPDRERAIREAIRRANAGEIAVGAAGPSRHGRARGEGDVILIAGKGHETYQILPDPDRPGQTTTRHFDDREVARAALLARHVRTRPPYLTTPVESVSPDDAADASLSEAIDETEALFESDGG